MSDYYYNSDSGAIDDQSGFLKWFNDNTGITDFNKKYLAWHGPFASKEEAFKYYQDNKAAHPEWHEPTDSLWQTFKNTTGNLGGSVADALGISGGQINFNNWFIRVGEIILGIVLIGVGVAKLTGTANAISRIAKVA